jgi:hypothetical protein
MRRKWSLDLRLALVLLCLMPWVLNQGRPLDSGLLDLPPAGG